MIHIDPALLRRKPILGVLLGGSTAVFIGYLLWTGSGEARALLAQKAPDAVSLHEAVSVPGTRWITVSDGQWQCERAITIERHPGLERWVRGPVEATEVPIRGERAGDVLVASFENGVNCAERRSSLTGVVGSQEIFTSRAALRRWSRSGDRVAVLHVGASPFFALIMLAGLGAIAFLAAGFAAYYLTIMLRSREEPAVSIASRDSIQPR